MLRVQLSGLLIMACVLVFSSGGVAQELPVKTELPPPESGPCETDQIVLLLGGEASNADRERARALLSEANQASILGEDDRARSLLREAAELDPESSEVAYRLGRLLQAVGEDQAALLEFCRYLALDAEGADVSEVEQRIEALAGLDEDPIPGIARIAFERGVSSLSEQRFEEAALHFSRALVELPNWPDAHYNRGLAYLGDGRAGAGRADLERYLELDPGAPDRDRVRARLREISPATVSTYNPRTALYAGIVFPGLGHFYSGRPATGMLFLAGAGTSAAVALLHTETVVNCLAPPDEDGECPPGQARDRVEERPLMVPGLAVAGAITLAGAIHAFVSARTGQDGFALVSETGGGFAIDAISGERWTTTFEVEPRGRWGTGGVSSGLRIRF